MVGESLERRRAVAQRMQQAREQQVALEELRNQVLPDGRRLGDVDRDGSLFDLLQALRVVVRRHSGFKLDLTTDEGLRLRILSRDGSLAVDVMQERREVAAGHSATGVVDQGPAETEGPQQVIDLRSPEQSPAPATRPGAAPRPEPSPRHGTRSSSLAHMEVGHTGESALEAALRRQKG